MERGAEISQTPLSSDTLGSKEQISFVYLKAQRDNEMSPERVAQFKQRRKLDASTQEQSQQTAM